MTKECIEVLLCYWIVETSVQPKYYPSLLSLPDHWVSSLPLSALTLLIHFIITHLGAIPGYFIATLLKQSIWHFLRCWTPWTNGLSSVVGGAAGAARPLGDKPQQQPLRHIDNIISLIAIIGDPFDLTAARHWLRPCRQSVDDGGWWLVG